MTTPDDYAAVVERLSNEFSGMFSPETIERYVTESLDNWSDARVFTCAPLLVERFAREHCEPRAKPKD